MGIGIAEFGIWEFGVELGGGGFAIGVLEFWKFWNWEIGIPNLGFKILKFWYWEMRCILGFPVVFFGEVELEFMGLEIRELGEWILLGFEIPNYSDFEELGILQLYSYFQ